MATNAARYQDQDSWSAVTRIGRLLLRWRWALLATALAAYLIGPRPEIGQFCGPSEKEGDLSIHRSGPLDDGRCFLVAFSNHELVTKEYYPAPSRVALYLDRPFVRLFEISGGPERDLEVDGFGICTDDEWHCR
jgi:hypothetical protein